jgi:YD repeat-containing protein
MSRYPGPVEATVRYRYDALNRLVETVYGSGERVQYSYDAVGNRTCMILSAIEREPEPPGAEPEELVESLGADLGPKTAATTAGQPELPVEPGPTCAFAGETGARICSSCGEPLQPGAAFFTSCGMREPRS